MMDKNKTNQNSKSKRASSHACQLPKWKHHHKLIDNLKGPTIMGDVEPHVQKAHESPTEGTQD